MKQYIEKICLALAASSLSDNEIKLAVKWIEGNGSRPLIEMITDARNAVHESVGSSTNRLPPMAMEYERPRGKLTSVDKGKLDIGSKIERLLKHEAGLSVEKAASLLLAALESHMEPGAQKNLPRPNKEGFRKWIARLTKKVSESLILNQATRIRNEKVHEPVRDWPLRRRDE